MSKKRTAEDRIEFYREKLKRLENSKRRRIIVYSDSSDSETDSLPRPNNEINQQAQIEPEPTNNDCQIISSDCPNSAGPVETAESDLPDDSCVILDPEILSALGDAAPEVPVYGPKIHQDLAQRWLAILRKGLTKETREIANEITIPENCKLLRAPSMNPEIAAALSDATRVRDKKLELCQQQLGLGITAINRAMTIILTSDDQKIQVLKSLSEACRILSDLHYQETQNRIKIATTGLDKQFLNVIQDTERDETLFGTKLSEKIKASKAIEKQVAQIKRSEAKPCTSRAPQPSTTFRESRFQGNSRTPSRSFNRGGARGGMRPSSTTRRGHPQFYNNSRPWNKYQRASNRPPQ